MESHDMDLKVLLKYMKAMHISIRTGTKASKNKPTVLLVFFTQVSTLLH
jgi:hypothetical protein